MQRAYELLLARLTEYDERGAYALWVAATEGRTVAESLERIAIPLLVRTGDDGAPVLVGEESPGLAVLHEGRVVEHGTHGDLVGAGGRYAELFALQAERYQA